MNRAQIRDELFNLKETTALLGFVAAAVAIRGAMGDDEIENALNVIYRTQSESIKKLYAALDGH